MNESRFQTVLSLFHVKPAPAPEKRPPYRSRQSGAHVVTIGLAVLLQQTALDLSRPRRMYLPRHSAAAVRRIPSGTTNSTGAATGRWDAASGCFSRAAAYDLPASGKGEAIASHPAAWSHGFCARRRRQSLTEHCRRTLHHWFHVKPTHKHGAGVMAAPTSFRGPLSQHR